MLTYRAPTSKGAATTASRPAGPEPEFARAASIPLMTAVAAMVAATSSANHSGLRPSQIGPNSTKYSVTPVLTWK